MKNEHIVLGTVVVIMAILLIDANIPKDVFVDDYGTDYGAVGVWNFEEGTGTTVYDQSPYGNDGEFSEDPIPEWLSGWGNRVKISLDSGDVDDVLSNFPHLIYLNDSCGINSEDLTFVFDEVGANSKKIAVTTDDGITETYVEVEKWDATNEQAWLWTNVTASSSSDTDVYLYYDNDHADNDAYVGVTNSLVAENVWDSDFLMVQHMATTSTPILDSTDNDIDMTEGGNPAYQQVGPIDGEIDYDGNDYHLSAINVFDAIVGTDKGTMSLWIKTTDSDAVNAMVVLSIEGAYMINFRPGEGGLLKTYWSGTQIDAARTTTQINTGAQFYIVSTYDGANQRVYVNGVLETTDACDLLDITGLNRATGLGSHYTGSFNINANIDDVRVSKTDRSVSWIKASYESGRDHLNDFGSEEILITVPTWTSGKYGESIEFEDSYVSVGNISLSAKTVEFWTYLDTTSEPILELSSGVDVSAVAGTITDSGWAGTTTIYVDGVEDSTVSAETWHYIGITSDTAEDCSALNLGKVGSTYLDGKLDQVRVYTETKTLGEIMNHYINSGGMYSGSVIVSDDFRILNTSFDEQFGITSEGIDFNLNFPLYMPQEEQIHVDFAAGVTDVELISTPSGIHEQDRHYYRLHVSVATAPGADKFVNVTISDGTNEMTVSITGADKSEHTITGAFDLDVSAEGMTITYSQTAGGASTEACIMYDWYYTENK